MYVNNNMWMFLAYMWERWELAVWHSGNIVGHINEVTLYQVQLVLGWVTICGPRGQVNHLSM